MGQIQNTLEYLYNQNVYFDWDERAPLGQSVSGLTPVNFPILREYSYCLNSPTTALSATYSYFVNDSVSGLSYFDKKYWVEEIKKQKDVQIVSEYMYDLDSVASVYHQVQDLNGITAGSVVVDNFDNNSKRKTYNYYNSSFASANSALNLEIVNLRSNNNPNSFNYTVDSLSVTQMATVKSNMVTSLSTLLPKTSSLTTVNNYVYGDVTLDNHSKTVYYISNSLSASNVYTNTLKVYDYNVARDNATLFP